jgi:hypothetical protein
MYYTYKQSYGEVVSNCQIMYPMPLDVNLIVNTLILSY